MRCGETWRETHHVYTDPIKARKVARSVSRKRGEPTIVGKCKRCGGYHWKRGTQ